MTVDLREAKRTLRQCMLAARDALPAAERAHASRAICERILASAEYVRAAAVLAYVGFGSELDTSLVNQHALAAGKALVLPRVDNARRTLVLHRVDDLDASLCAGTWGIREPDPTRCAEVDPSTVEFVLVPGVAFSRDCARLGYGAGYYDRLIPSLVGRPPLVAGAYAVQMVAAVPMGPSDMPVDRVVTERETYSRSQPEQRE